MPVNLKPTDVVVVGLGAAGGVAVLPLTQAGIEVIGLEAGTWLRTDDFAPDELRNNFRGWPQAVQKANREIPTHRTSSTAPTSPRLAIHPMMNAVGGTTLHYWAQSWRLNPWDFKVVSETTRRYGASTHSEGFYGRRLAIRTRGTRAVLRQGRVRDRRLGTGRQRQGQDRSARQHVRRRAIARVSDAGAARNQLHRQDGGGRAQARMASIPRTRRGGDARVSRSRGLRVPRVLLAGRLSHQRQGFDGGHLNPQGAGDEAAVGGDRSTRHHYRSRRQRSRERRQLHQGRQPSIFQPAKVVLVASYVYENVRLLLLSKSKAFPNGLSNNHGQVGRHYFSHNQIGGVTALFPTRLNNWYGLPAQGVAVDEWADDNFDHSGLDFIGGGNLWVYSDRRPISAASMSTYGRAPRWGSAWKAFIKRERRLVERLIPSEDDAAVRGELSRSRSDGEGSARLPGVPHHG